jgi:hypothetical protein
MGSSEVSRRCKDIIFGFKLEGGNGRWGTWKAKRRHAETKNV